MFKRIGFSLGVTRMDTVRNECIREAGRVDWFGDKVREARLGYFAHVQRRESRYTGQRMLNMEEASRRKTGRSQRGFIDGAG